MAALLDEFRKPSLVSLRLCMRQTDDTSLNKPSLQGE